MVCAGLTVKLVVCGATNHIQPGFGTAKVSIPSMQQELPQPAHVYAKIRRDRPQVTVSTESSLPERHLAYMGLLIAGGRAGRRSGVRSL